MTTWLIVSGIVLVIVGFVLRTILMMRASDTTTRDGPVLGGRELLRRYDNLFPQSPIPFVMRSTLIGGALLLLAGVSCHVFQHG